MRNLFALFSLALTSCFSSERFVLGEECKSSMQCKSGLACLDGRCAQPPETSGGSVAAPKILSIRGDGSSASRIAAALIVDGENLASVSLVSLLDAAGKSIADLLISNASASSLSLAVPAATAAIIANNPSAVYTLVLTSAAGSARQDVQILRGEPGPPGVAGSQGPQGSPGPTGPAGNSGIRVVQQDLYISWTRGSPVPAHETVTRDFVLLTPTVSGVVEVSLDIYDVNAFWASKPELLFTVGPIIGGSVGTPRTISNDPLGGFGIPQPFSTHLAFNATAGVQAGIRLILDTYPGCSGGRGASDGCGINIRAVTRFTPGITLE